MSVEMKPAMMRAKDAATYLGVSVREVRRLVGTGDLEPRYVGKASSREYRILTTSADAYIASLPSEPVTA